MNTKPRRHPADGASSTTHMPTGTDAYILTSDAAQQQRPAPARPAKQIKRAPASRDVMARSASLVAGTGEPHPTGHAVYVHELLALHAPERLMGWAGDSTVAGITWYQQYAMRSRHWRLGSALLARRGGCAHILMWPTAVSTPADWL
jgi:hypothetical protein